jgi:dTDP-4-dehydrorhamnose reductase
VKVLVTGANGMLGKDVAAAANAVHHEVVALGREDLDVTDAGAVQRVFERELPAVVVNCAAFTAVDRAELEEDAAFAVNAEGAGVVATAAASINAKVIYPSTDYVFDGLNTEPYVEVDEPNPRSAYGRTKLAGEVATAQANPRHLIVRTSWLFGLHGPNFVETMLALAEKQNEVLVVRDQTGCPTFTGHLADAIVQLLDFEALGIHHIAGGESCTWWDFAVEIFRQAQVDCTVLSGSTEMLDRPAPRPPFSALISTRADSIVLPRWDHGLHSYLLARSERSATAEPDDSTPGEEPS